jgi:DJ-1/PfpI family
VAEWLREHAEGSRTVVSVCAGAEVLADAGLLDGRRATANWAGIDKWERRYPNTEWVRGRRYVEDGNVLTAAAVTSGVGATLHVVRGYVGGAAARELAREIGYPDQRLGDEPRIPAKHLTASDAALYILGAAYGWGKPRIGVILTEGASEIELASVSDVYPGQSFTANTTTMAPGGPRSLVRSEHGLYFVPRSDLGDAPKLDRVLVPGSDAPSAIEPRVSSWARDRGLKLEFIHAGTSAGFPFDATLSDLAEHENVPVAEFRAKGLEYPTDGLELSGDGWPFGLLLRPLAVGLLGLALAALIDRLLGPATKRFRRSLEGSRYLGAGWRFTRHLLEMVVAMFAGMAVLGVALAVLGEPPGYDAHPLVRDGLMGAFMAAPMVAWMRHQGHSWTDGLEMTVAMLVPMLALVVPVELGVARYVPGLSEQSLPIFSHVAMIAGMVVLMIYRFERYAHEAHGAARSAPTASPGNASGALDQRRDSA